MAGPPPRPPRCQRVPKGVVTKLLSLLLLLLVLAATPGAASRLPPQVRTSL